MTDVKDPPCNCILELQTETGDGAGVGFAFQVAVVAAEIGAGFEGDALLARRLVADLEVDLAALGLERDVLIAEDQMPPASRWSPRRNVVLPFDTRRG